MNLSIVLLNQDSTIADRILAAWESPGDEGGAILRRAPAARRASLLGRAVLRALLASRAETPGLRLAAANGKILALTPSGSAGPAVSMSHSGDLLAAAVADGDAPFGIDIEVHRHRDFAALAAYAFGTGEQAAVRSGGAEAFFRIWTLREAMAKASGVGLAEVVDRRDRIAGGPAEGCWSAGGWQLGHVRPGPGISLAFALRHPDPMTFGISDGQALIGR